MSPKTPIALNLDEVWEVFLEYMRHRMVPTEYETVVRPMVPHASTPSESYSRKRPVRPLNTGDGE